MEIRKILIGQDVQLLADDVPAIMDEAGIGFTPITHVNWEEYPYRPEAAFRISHTGDAILLHYRVTEDSVRAKYDEDDGSVWTDSCVEFFLSPQPEDSTYYNIECNCIGTILLGGGHIKPDRERATADRRALIKRWASLGHKAFEERMGRCTWEVALIIPSKALFLHDNIKTFDGLQATGNFYKCGDELHTPHFLSWAPIDTPKPNFHCPAFFAPLTFAPCP